MTGLASSQNMFIPNRQIYFGASYKKVANLLNNTKPSKNESMLNRLNKLVNKEIKVGNLKEAYTTFENTFQYAKNLVHKGENDRGLEIACYAGVVSGRKLYNEIEKMRFNYVIGMPVNKNGIELLKKIGFIKK